MLYQAKAQIDLGGTAVAKTIGKMLGRQASTRILQRLTRPCAVHYPNLHVATKYTSAYLRACRALFRPVDSHGHMALHHLRPTLERHGLLGQDDDDNANVDAWLQRPQDGHITFPDFVDACFTLVGPSLAAKWVSRGGGTGDNWRAASSLSNVSTADAKVQHHPYDAMMDQHRHAVGFSYEAHAANNPVTQQDITTLSHSHSLVMDTPYRCIRRVVSDQDLHDQVRAAAEVAKKALKVKTQRHLAATQRCSLQFVLMRDNNDYGAIAWSPATFKSGEKRQMGHQEKVAHVHRRKHENQSLRAEMEEFNAVEMIRRQKDLFTISDSTCTLQRRPPELLAALAGVQTPKQQKSLAIAEHRYFEQSRSQQLRDYKHDKEDAKPKRYLRAPIVDVDQQDPDEGWHNEEAELTAAMNALYAEWVQEQRDLSPLIPTANSPPAAQRYYGTIKQMPPSMDQYEHVRVIGKGSFGIVSKILRKVDNKELVWKEVDYGQMTEKEKQLIVSEVNILRELKHPHIVRYLDRVIDKQSTKIFIVMEYCEGGDLSRLIKRHRRDGYVAVTKPAPRNNTMRL
ncbi:hypothetical protein DYB37_008168 [Aphanomyces astaci]|uniref:non-specific serine/threonine protein kinase n=1 Tax=Aphanomyces astaci TaxID=112090 RepID=A0A418DQV8_APHAT|nr:hypothetical protein DYB35_007623 [Aphanomyces astaci]RHZ25244.1 hypothetical protein DYB37_008168 [Aphanomyces astaci]